MFNNRQLFCTFNPHSPITHVTLGYGETKRTCEGIGTIDIVIYSKVRVQIHNVLFVPTLTESLFSTLQHIENPGCAELSSDKCSYIIFPDHVIHACMGASIKLHITAGSQSHLPITFVARAQAPVFQPQDFPQTHRVITRSSTTTPANCTCSKSTTQNSTKKKSVTNLPQNSSRTTPVDISGSPSKALSQRIVAHPLMRPVDKVSSTVPNLVSFTPDILRHCVGF